MLYSHVNTQYGLNAQPLFPYLTDQNSSLGVFGAYPVPSGNEYVPVTAPTNPALCSRASTRVSPTAPAGYAALVHNRFEQNPRLFQDDDQSLTGVAGLRGTINADWSWEAAANFNRYTDNYTNPGVLDENNLIGDFVSGQVNPFAINQAPGVPEQRPRHGLRELHQHQQHL